MKAIVYKQYGTPEVLSLADVDKPSPKDDEVLVRVCASSVNSWDWDLLTGTPKVYRLLFGLFKPKHAIIGFDIAGVVEAVGSKVSKFRPGDEVVGDLSESGMGGFAEFTCAREQDLIMKPKSVSFDEAASIPQAATLAFQGLNFAKPLQAGEQVLINGAGGGAGTLAIQMAKQVGAVVTAVDSAEKLEMVLSLGADYVLDYKHTDFVSNGKKYDRILDVMSTRSVFDYSKCLKEGGVLGVVGGKVPSILQVAFLGFVIGKKKLGIVVHKPNKDLALIFDMVATAKIKPVIDRMYKLNEVPDAFRYFGSGKHLGKIVILV